jgi:hypothetical protein
MILPRSSALQNMFSVGMCRFKSKRKKSVQCLKAVAVILGCTGAEWEFILVQEFCQHVIIHLYYLRLKK